MRKLILIGLAQLIVLAGCGGGSSSEGAPPTGVDPPPANPPPTNPPPANPPPTNPPSAAPTQADAARFLEQATFGPTKADIAHVVSVGFEAWLNEQFAQAATGYPGFDFVAHTAPDTCKYDSTAPSGAASLCARDNYSLFQVQRMFFTNALTAPDQLRQRVAFALSQIFVVSGTEIYEAYGMASYQNMLLKDAFVNFRTLMNDVTLHPVMGNYLDMVNNDKPNASKGTNPNENYARELMQLFTLGLYQLNADGSIKNDSQGRPMPAYDQNVVEGYAHVFTGWTYPAQTGAASKFFSPINYSGNMILFDDHHDTAAKDILDGRTLPAGQGGAQDLKDGLDAIFNHPNVGPFIATRLIQHLVTSNPSPAYVARIAAVFADNGSGTRGDLKAVIRAILLDSEARGDAKVDATYGHLREPALWMTTLMRELGGRSDGVYLRSQASSMGQNIFVPASVFSFYSPFYRLPASTAGAPEFQIQDTSTSLNRSNFINQLVFNGGAAADATVTNSIGTTLDLSALASLAGDSTQLIGELNARMMHGTLSTSANQAIDGAVNAVAATDALGRARAAVYLFASMPQFQVEH